ncbi:hypothetical protein H6769_01585 [Candidatus Peribacteria bacterium]|nr:hypothetical protein [Candidatus Peribacteria bacterium]
MIAGVRDQENANRESRKNYESIILDVTSQENRSKLLGRIKELGSIDVLINNAAISGW